MTIKKSMGRILLGFPLGMAIGVVILLVISAVVGDGRLHIASPELEALAGSELGAAALQFALCGLLGSAYAGGSVFFENERWSLARQTALHFVLVFSVQLIIAWINYWIPHTAASVAAYAGIWLAVYIVIWLVQYRVWLRRIRETNDNLSKYS